MFGNQMLARQCTMPYPLCFNGNNTRGENVERSALKIELMLEQVIKFDASDLHVQVGLPPMLRVDGSLKPIEDTPVLEPADVEKLVFSILDDDQKEILIKDKEVD